MKKKCLNYLALLLLIVSLSNCKTSVNTKEELIKVHSIAYEQRLSEYVYFINNSFYFLNSHDLYKLTYAGEQLKLFEDVKSIEFIDGCLFVDEEYLVVCDDEGLYPKDLTDLYLDEVPFSFGDY
ncbi:MAG: hypothetical protein LBR25_04900, partial [Erysipelotrichaceae bacterium]|nr:hypothetical protein [Erysipelotrichaceae bacterium]